MLGLICLIVWYAKGWITGYIDRHGIIEWRYEDGS